MALLSLRQPLPALVSLLLLILCSVAYTQPSQIAPHSSDAPASLTFTANRGQVADVTGISHPEILYTTSFGGVDIFVAARRISYVYRRYEGDWKGWRACDHNPHDFDGAAPTVQLYRMDMDLLGSNPNPTAVSSEKIDGYCNYYLPHCPDGLLHVPGYRTVVLKDIYPKIDMVLRGNHKGMKCDYIVHPGGNPSDIRIRYSGGISVALIGRGALRVENTIGFLEEDAPYSFQPTRALNDTADAAWLNSTGGSRVSSRWSLSSDGVVGFKIGSYDPTRTLVIDPTRRWSTYYGGSGTDYFSSSDASEIDRDGDAYFAAQTANNAFPVTTGPGYIGAADVVVVKMKSDGTRLWATMIGGTLDDIAHAIASDSGRNVMVTGHTYSSNFPVANAQQGTNAGNRDAFVVKFDTNGARLWSTYCGGGALDDGCGIAVDSSGNPAVVGVTSSTSAIAAGAGYDLSYNGGVYDGFLIKYSSAGVRQWGSYLGGSSTDCAWAAAIDARDNLTVGGWTRSNNFPTLRAHQGALNGAVAGTHDLFVAQFSRTGALRWSTYYGGTGNDGCDVGLDPILGYLGVAADRDANVFVAGSTTSIDFPLSNAPIQGTYGGGTRDGFIVKFDTGGVRQWATYQGGAGDDRLNAAACNTSGSVLVTGATASANFPGITPDAYRATYNGGDDAFVVKINSAGTTRQYATYYGGTGLDEGRGISTDPHGTFVVAGETSSTDFPITAGCFQAANAGDRDAFITLFCDPDTHLIDTLGPTTFCPGDSLRLAVIPGYKTYLWSTGATSNRITVRTTGIYYVDVVNAAGCAVRSDTVRVVTWRKPNPSVTPGGTVPICQGDSVQLSVGNSRFASYAWYDSTLTNLRLSGSGPSFSRVTVKSAGTYRVIVTDTTGCIDTSATVTVVVNPNPIPVDILPLGRDTLAICKGGPAILAANRQTFAGETFTWTPSGSGTSVTPATTGNYQLKVTTSAGCTTLSRSVYVKVNIPPSPRIFSNPGSTICEGDTVRLDTYPFYRRFLWSTGDTTSFIRVRASGLYTVVVTDSNDCQGTDSLQVTVVPLPQPMITALGSVEFCQGDSVRLDAGFGYNEYLWSTTEASQTILVKDSGDYSVQVRGGPSNCFGLPSNLVKVRIHPRPSPRLAGPMAICVNATASYTTAPLPGVRYEWFITGAGGVLVDGQGTDSITVKWGGAVATGKVRLRMTDTTTLCFTDTTLSIAIGTALAPTVIPNMVNLCLGDTRDLDAGPGYDSYEWVDKSGNIVGTSRIVTVKDSGTYFVRIAKGTCAGQSGLIPVRWVQPPTPRITVASGDTTICPGGMVVVLDAGAYAKYQWTPAVPGSTGRRIIVSDSGVYQVMVTDNNGCTGLSGLVRVRVVDPPIPIITGSPAVCLTSRMSYSVVNQPGSSYNWTIAGGLGSIASGQGTSTVMIDWTSAGSGFLSVQQITGAANCIRTSPLFSIDVGNTLTVVITAEGSTPLCDGDSLVLRAPRGFSIYRWSDGSGATLGTDDSLLVRAGGRYRVDISSPTCSGSGDIIIAQKAPIVSAISGVMPLCEGDTLLLGAEAGYARYLWSNGDTTRTTRITTSGSYTVRCTDTDGCSGLTPAVAITVNPPPVVAITTVGDNLTATAGSAYQWYLDGKPITAGVTQNLQARVNGAYAVRVTDSNGCSAVSAAVPVAAGASATIAIRDYQATPGERVSIRLELSNGTYLDRNGIRNFIAKIRFNRTLLVPTQSYPSAYVGDDRILTVSGAIPSAAMANGPLTTLEFIAALGNAPQTPITIEAFSFVEDTAITTTINGTFSVMGLCTTGGTRLIDGSGATTLRPVRPNPVIHSAEVEYEIVEDGMTQLYLVDVLGRVTPLVHAQLPSGRYIATFDLSMLSSGVYICVLQTPTQRLNTVMQIIR
jgi:hypothetical protein